MWGMRSFLCDVNSEMLTRRVDEALARVFGDERGRRHLGADGPTPFWPMILGAGRQEPQCPENLGGSA